MNSILRYPGGGAAGRILALPLLIAVLLLMAASGWGGETISGNSGAVAPDYDSLTNWMSDNNNKTGSHIVTITSTTNSKDYVNYTTGSGNAYSFANTLAAISITGRAGANYQIGYTGTNSANRVMHFNIVPTVSLSNVDILGGGVNANNTEYINSSSTLGGAALAVVNSTTASFTNMIISNNITGINNKNLAISATGAVSMRNGTGTGTRVTFDRVTLSGNKAQIIGTTSGSSNASGGGASIINVATVTYQNGNVTGNIADYAGSDNGQAFGGGIAIRNGTTDTTATNVNISTTNFKDNHATSTKGSDKTGDGDGNASGGALFLNSVGGAYTINLNGGNVFEDNTAETDSGDAHARGGAIHLESQVSGDIAGATFTRNKAITTGDADKGGISFGGAIVINADDNNSTPAIDFTGNIYEANEARSDNGHAHGGAVYSNRSIALTNETFKNNKATGGLNAIGGGLFINTADGKTNETLSVTNSTFTGNRATSSGSAASSAIGGGMASYAYTTSILGSIGDGGTFRDNKAVATGAGSTAFGGGAYVARAFQTSTSASITNASFVSNLASGDAGASGGGLYLGSTNSLTLDNLVFTNNHAVATATTGATTAHGGGLYSLSSINIATKATFEGNTAEANSTSNTATAEGGAMWLAHGNHSVANTTFKNNTASADNARGGAIYLDGGTLTATDSDFIGNQANGNGTDAWGGAIFANTNNNGTVATIINLNASAGKTMEFTNNSAGSKYNSIYFGEGSVSTGTAQNAQLNINVADNAKMIMSSPIVADMENKNFNLSVRNTGTGELKWSGTNIFTTTGATTLTLDGGSVTFGDDFTARAEGAGSYTVNIEADTLLRVSATRGRNTSLAIFDFNENAPAGSKTFNVVNSTNKTTLEVTTGRELISDDWTLVIASGLNANEMANAKANLIITSANSSLLTVDAAPVEDGNKLVAHINFRSPYMDAGENAHSALPALDQLIKVKDVFDRYTHNDDQVNAILLNPWASTPEQYMDQARVMAQGVSTVADLALKVGVRDPHRMSLAGDAYPGYEPVRYPTRAAPRLMDCYTPGIGLRFWAGYVGDFHKRDADGSFNGYRADRHGFVAGLNYDFGTTGSVGLYGGYTHAETKARRAGAETESDSGHFGLLGRVSPIPGLTAFSVFGDVGYHFSGNDTRRHLGNYEASGDFDQDVFTAAVGTEYDISLGNFDIVPYFRGRYTYVSQDSMNESGLTATHINSFHDGSFTTRLGAEFSTNILFSGGVVSPTLNLAWNHEWSSRNLASTAYYLGDPAPIRFAVSSLKPARDSMDIGVGAKAMLNLGGVPRVGVNVGYNLNLSRRSDTHSVHVAFELGF